MIETLNVVVPNAFRELVTAGSVSSVLVKGADKGLVIVLRVGMNERVVGAVRGGPRYFQSIDGAASVLKQYGIVDFSVNVSNWVPRTMAKKAA